MSAARRASPSGGESSEQRGLPEVVRHRYGPEGPAYVRDQLEFAWNPLAALLLAARDIEQGRAWAFVPREWSSERRRNFVLGGQPEEPDSSELALEWIHGRLRTLGEDGILVAEDPFASRSDYVRYPERNRGDLFFCGENVYAFAGAGTPHLAPVLWPDYPTVAMLTRQEGLDLPRLRCSDVPPEALTQMAEATEAIVVAAWDAVGFVVWQPT